MIDIDKQIELFEIKIKKLVKYANYLHENPESPLREYFDNQQRIDRLKFCIKELQKRKNKERKQVCTHITTA